MFDVAEHLLVVNIEDGGEASRTEERIQETVASRKAARLAELGVDTLVCGAVSRPLEEMVMASGIQVIPWRCGPVDSVLEAFASGRLKEEAFLMPGCCGRRRQARGRGRHRGSRGHTSAYARRKGE